MNIADLFGGVFVPGVVINPWMQAKRPHCVLSLTAFVFRPKGPAVHPARVEGPGKSVQKITLGPTGRPFNDPKD